MQDARRLLFVLVGSILVGIAVGLLIAGVAVDAALTRIFPR